MKVLNKVAPLAGTILLFGTSLGVTAALAQERSTPAALATAGRADSKLASVPADVNSTYLRDVLPIIMGRCARCHNDQTTILPNWMDYKTAFEHRREIRRRVWDCWKGTYYKQPMPAGGGPECQAMTEEERRIIKDWVESGAVCGVPPGDSGPKSKPERIALGKQLFSTVCSLCHQPDGRGIPSKFPPLAQSDFLNFDKDRAIKVLLQGRRGEIVVNGQKFNNSMPSLPLRDEDVANALTFVYNSFGNSGKEVTPEEVKTLRAQKGQSSESVAQQDAPRVPDAPSPFE